MARQRKEKRWVARDGNTNGPPAQRVRRHCTGEHGNPPRVPRPINVSHTHILDSTATKTLLAILRARWPIGAFSLRGASEDFFPYVLKEFRTYYCYSNNVSDDDGDRVVKLHVARTMTQVQYEERERAQKRAARNNKPLLEQCPVYFNKSVWKSFCAHWGKKSFQKKSAINAENRKKQQVVHTTGAKCFHKFQQDLTEKYDTDVTVIQFWDDSHKKKDSNEWASERAQEIGERMREIYETRQEDSQESDHEWNSGILALIEAQWPIKKNRIVGLPRQSANSVIQSIRAEQQTQRRDSNQPRRSGPEPSRSGPAIPNEILTEIVQRTLKALQSDPSFDGLRHPSQQQLHVLAEKVINGSDFAHEFMQTEISLIVRIIEGVFEEVFK